MAPLVGAATERRVRALLARMTLDQKIGQMTQPERLHVTPAQVKRYHIGSVLSGGGSCPGDNRPSDWVAMNDAYWAASMEEDAEHLAIPVLYGVDAIHGNANVRGATVFPHNIGLGAARDPELVERIGRATAREVRAAGVDWTFAPTLAVAQDPRWGRTYESYSEDPGLVGEYAGGIVRGLQGGGVGRLDGGMGRADGLRPVGPEGVVACAKHWVGDGGTRDGVDQGDTVVDEAELRRVHIAPYVPALEAGVLTVMVSLSSWNGQPCHAHRYLIRDVLKGEMGFGGFVLSDWNGVDPLADDYGEAAAAAVNAGIDMVMVPERWREFIGGLKRQVERGVVPVGRIDDAVARILRVKVASGLFERRAAGSAAGVERGGVRVPGAPRRGPGGRAEVAGAAQERGGGAAAGQGCANPGDGPRRARPRPPVRGLHRRVAGGDGQRGDRGRDLDLGRDPCRGAGGGAVGGWGGRGRGGPPMRETSTRPWWSSASAPTPRGWGTSGSRVRSGRARTTCPPGRACFSRMDARWNSRRCIRGP